MKEGKGEGVSEFVVGGGKGWRRVCGVRRWGLGWGRW